VDGTPQAELWLGAHPKGPSTVVKGLLNHLVDADPAGVVGTASVRAFGPRLPYLLKLLAADQPLSLTRDGSGRPDVMRYLGQ
jgi:mannose-6-phosphate isomerase